MPRTDAASAIQKQVERGREILALRITTWEELEAGRADRRKWSARNIELLTRLFDNRSIAEEYNRFLGGSISMRPVLAQEVDRFRDETRDLMTRLEAVLERLDLIPERGATLGAASVARAPSNSTSSDSAIFVVHGHDEGARESVARFLERLGLTPIVLHEQPNSGRTIIEKFEAYANVAFAVVLLSPDDDGAPRGHKASVAPRARQNVVFELGFFFGSLGRSRVCALIVGDLERPSDIDGLLYIDMRGDWRLALAKELRQAGFSIDMNEVV